MPKTKKTDKSSNRPFILSIEGNIGSENQHYFDI